MRRSSPVQRRKQPARAAKTPKKRSSSPRRSPPAKKPAKKAPVKKTAKVVKAQTPEARRTCKYNDFEGDVPICAITLEPIAPGDRIDFDGHCFSKIALRQWVKKGNDTNPMTRKGFTLAERQLIMNAASMSKSRSGSSSSSSGQWPPRRVRADTPDTPPSRRSPPRRRSRNESDGSDDEVNPAALAWVYGRQDDSSGPNEYDLNDSFIDNRANRAPRRRSSSNSVRRPHIFRR